MVIENLFLCVNLYGITNLVYISSVASNLNFSDYTLCLILRLLYLVSGET
jgi:hypothetical protein